MAQEFKPSKTIDCKQNPSLSKHAKKSDSKRLAALCIVLIVEFIISLSQGEIRSAIASLSPSTSAPLSHEYNCSFCHYSSSSAQPAAINAVINCQACHSEITAGQLHSRSNSRSSCLLCHQMHVGLPKLLKQPVGHLCQSCHTGQAQRVMAGEHSEIGLGNKGPCISCHQAHPVIAGAQEEKDTIAECLKCHKYDESYNHPVGDQVIDKNTGNELTCTSNCHDAHGTQYPHLLKTEDDDSLCIQCHEITELS